MIVNLGGGIAIFKKDIVGIFDFEEITSSDDGREFFRKLKKSKILEICEKGKIPQSLVLCIDDLGKEKYYLSSVSVSTLRK